MHRAGAAAARAHARITRPAACGFQGGGGRDRRSAGGGSHVTASAWCGAAERGPDACAPREGGSDARGPWPPPRSSTGPPWGVVGAEPRRGRQGGRARACGGVQLRCTPCMLCAPWRGSKSQGGPKIFYFFSFSRPKKKILNPPLPFSLKKSVQGVQGVQYPVYHPSSTRELPPPQQPAPAPSTRTRAPPRAPRATTTTTPPPPPVRPLAPHSCATRAPPRAPRAPPSYSSPATAPPRLSPPAPFTPPAAPDGPAPARSSACTAPAARCCPGKCMC